ncbi:hypothetical protein UlMin_036380 [Ulmus minor]
MEIELGLKITKTKHDFTSTSQFQFSKDSSGPVFLSRETNKLFILVAHLKGFEKDQIAIKINEDGTQIAISAEKAVQEMAMVGWIMQEKEVELRGFVKIFRIPDDIDLDRIKAKFDEQDAVLTILMPKLAKGIRGVGIEEVKEEEVYRGRPEMTQIASQEIPNGVVKMEETDRIKQRKREDKEEAGKGIEAKEFRKERDGEFEKVQAAEGGKKEELHEVDTGELEGTQSVTKKGEAKQVADLTKELAPRKEKNNGDEATSDVETFPTEETQRKEVPAMEEEKQKQEIIEDDSFPLKQDEERTKKEEFRRVQGLEAMKGSKESQSDHADEKFQTSYLQDDHGIDGKEVGGVEETQKKKPFAPTKLKLCTPCLIASSTVIVSIVVFALHWFRSKRKEVP